MDIEESIEKDYFHVIDSWVDENVPEISDNKLAENEEDDFLVLDAWDENRAPDASDSATESYDSSSKYKSRSKTRSLEDSEHYSHSNRSENREITSPQSRIRKSSPHHSSQDSSSRHSPLQETRYGNFSRYRNRKSPEKEYSRYRNISQDNRNTSRVIRQRISRSTSRNGRILRKRSPERLLNKNHRSEESLAPYRRECENTGRLEVANQRSGFFGGNVGLQNISATTSNWVLPITPLYTPVQGPYQVASTPTVRGYQNMPTSYICHTFSSGFSGPQNFLPWVQYNQRQNYQGFDPTIPVEMPRNLPNYSPFTPLPNQSTCGYDLNNTNSSIQQNNMSPHIKFGEARLNTFGKKNELFDDYFRHKLNSTPLEGRMCSRSQSPEFRRLRIKSAKRRSRSPPASSRNYRNRDKRYERDEELTATHSRFEMSKLKGDHDQIPMPPPPPIVGSYERADKKKRMIRSSGLETEKDKQSLSNVSHKEKFSLSFLLEAMVEKTGQKKKRKNKGGIFKENSLALQLSELQGYLTCHKSTQTPKKMIKKMARRPLARRREPAPASNHPNTKATQTEE